MRILQIVNYYYPHIGGIEKIAEEIAGVLKESGHEQKIICFNEPEGAQSGFSKTVVEDVDGIEVTRCGCIGKIVSQSISFAFPTELEKIMKSFAPEVVIFHYPNPFMAEFLLMHRLRSFKLLIYWHLDITKQKYLKRFFHKQNLRLINRAEKILGATPVYLAESEYSDSFKEKRTIVPYMVDTEQLAVNNECYRLTKEIRKKNREKTICFTLGRHVEYKGIRYLIEASKKLDNSFIFFVGGEGKLMEEHKKQASGDSKIVFLGKISDNERIAYLNACDIFCFPSITKNEAFGLALAEAMYFGKPAVTFHIPGSGVNYLCPDGVTGIECPNADSGAFAAAIKKLAAEPELRAKFGVAARKRIEKDYSKSAFAENIKRVLDNESID